MKNDQLFLFVENLSKSNEKWAKTSSLASKISSFIYFFILVLLAFFKLSPVGQKLLMTDSYEFKVMLWYSLYACLFLACCVIFITNRVLKKMAYLSGICSIVCKYSHGESNAVFEIEPMIKNKILNARNYVHSMLAMLLSVLILFIPLMNMLVFHNTIDNSTMILIWLSALTSMIFSIFKYLDVDIF